MTPLQQPELRSLKDDPAVGLKLRNSEIDYILETLNRNPAGAPVMAVARLMAKVGEQRENGLKLAAVQAATLAPPAVDAA